ncbi:hypothetical protein D3C87_1570190 [compost metagenome]
MILPRAIGAVVDGVPITVQTPLSGHFCPVDAVVPIGIAVSPFSRRLDFSVTKEQHAKAYSSTRTQRRRDRFAVHRASRFRLDSSEFHIPTERPSGQFLVLRCFPHVSGKQNWRIVGSADN